MAWIRWRRTASGARLATVQWRNDQGRVRSRALKTSDPRIVEMLRRATEATEEGKALPTITVDAADALARFLAHVKLTRAPETLDYYTGKLGPLWGAWSGTRMAAWTRPMLEAYIGAHPDWSPREYQGRARKPGY